MGFKFFLKVSFHIKSSPGKDLRLIMIDSRQHLHWQVQILALTIFLYFHDVFSPILFPLFLQYYYLYCAFTSPLLIISILFYYLFYIHYLPLSTWKLQLTTSQQANLASSLQVVTSLTLTFCLIKVIFFSHSIGITKYCYSGSNKFSQFFKHLLNWSWNHRVKYQICQLCREICILKPIKE